MNKAHLCLGTASWGGPYNGRTQPSDEELLRILSLARQKRVRWIDTAHAYGNAEQRLLELGADHSFRIATKVKPNHDWLEEPMWPMLRYSDILLQHLGPEDAPSPSFGHVGRGQLWGVSVYTLEQAWTSLALGAQVLQVPWSWRSVSQAWFDVRDRAYQDGVLFFGRQPFAKDNQRLLDRLAFQWAVETNPRGWCVVGVELAVQLEELLSWAI